MEWRGFKASQNVPRQKVKWGRLYMVDKVTTAILSKTHTHSYADSQAQKYTHLATNEVGQATGVGVDEGNSERERQKHTQSSVEPGKISPVPKK